MTRSRWMMLASALAAVAAGCAHCDTCDDMPLPCAGRGCGTAMNMASGPMSGPGAAPMVAEPRVPPGNTIGETPSIAPPSLPDVPADPATPPPAPAEPEKP